MLTPRGRLALALGGAIYVIAWAFGATALYPVAVGLLLAVGLAWGWVRLLDKPMELRRTAWGGEHLEGDDISIVLELVPEARLAPRTAHVVDRVARVGEREVALRRSGSILQGRYVLRGMARGRYAYEGATLVVEDPFGLERAERSFPPGGALLVYPRLVELDRTFSEAGMSAHGGRRLLMRRPSGFDLHSVRDYEQGESLRKVHWKTTARRGRLMVKELEDEPRDEIAVLLDATAGTAAGEPPDSSFDVQVRAAGSLLRAHARRGRRVALVVSSLGREALGVGTDEGDWRRALDVLAAAEPTGRTPVAALLAPDASAAARALELTVVTAQMPADLADRIAQRAGAHRAVSVVYVDAASFVGAVSEPVPALLRLQSLGVPVAVVRRGDDLGTALAGAPAREAAGA